MSTATQTPATKSASYAANYDAIVRTMDLYLAGGREGRSALMRPAFHPAATIAGYCAGSLLTGPIQQLFDWIEQNGPAPNVQARFAAIDVIGAFAAVRLEVEGWTGALAGDGASMSDLFTLVKVETSWQIVQKAFHWHE